MRGRNLVPWLQGYDMDVCYRFDEAAKVLVTHPSGPLSDAAVIKYAAAKAADAKITAGTRELVDLQDITDVSVTERSLRMLAQTYRNHAERFRKHKIAVIAPGDLLFGIARMYELISDTLEAPVNIAVFRTPEDATAWLDCKPGMPG